MPRNDLFHEPLSKDRLVKKKIIAAVAAAAFLPLLASAQFAKTEDAINYRQSALFIMGQHFGRIGAMVNDKIPFDAAQAKESAAIVNVVGKLPWTAFVPNSDKGGHQGAHRKSGRIPASSRPRRSGSSRCASQARCGHRHRRQGEDQGSVRRGSGRACKNCHDSFRAK